MTAIFALFVPMTGISTGGTYTAGTNRVYRISAVDFLSFLTGTIDGSEENYCETMLNDYCTVKKENDTKYYRLSLEDVQTDVAYRRSYSLNDIEKSVYVDVVFNILRTNDANSKYKNIALITYNDYYKHLEDLYKNNSITVAEINKLIEHKNQIINTINELSIALITDFLNTFPAELECGNLDGLHYFISAVKEYAWDRNTQYEVNDTAANREAFDYLADKFLAGKYSWNAELVEKVYGWTIVVPFDELQIADNNGIPVILRSYNKDIELIPTTSMMYQWTQSGNSLEFDMDEAAMQVFALPMTIIGLAGFALILLFDVGPLISVLTNIKQKRNLSYPKKSFVFTTVILFFIMIYYSVMMPIMVSGANIFVLKINAWFILTAVLFVAKIVCTAICGKMFVKARRACAEIAQNAN